MVAGETFITRTVYALRIAYLALSFDTALLTRDPHAGNFVELASNSLEVSP